jgi:hypothetical protein
MKHACYFLLLLPLLSPAQRSCVTELIDIAERRSQIIQLSYNGGYMPDSLETYNDKLQNRLLECTKTIESLTANTNSFADNNIGVSTSPDNRFRVYSWDDQTGGTMRYGVNIFQFSDGKNVYSQPSDWDGAEDGVPAYFYDVIDHVVSNGKTFYVVTGVFIGSSAASLHKIKIFSIDDGHLNPDAVLIKTASGIQNELGYEVDFSDKDNWKNPKANREWADLQYDPKTKTIAIPLITEAGQVTSRKIRYRFNGTYFVKL